MLLLVTALTLGLAGALQPTSRELRNTIDARADIRHVPLRSERWYTSGTYFGGLPARQHLKVLRARGARTCSHVTCRHEVHQCAQRAYLAGSDNPHSNDPERPTWAWDYATKAPIEHNIGSACDGRRWSSVRVNHRCSNLHKTDAQRKAFHCDEEICHESGAFCAMEENGKCTCVERKGHDPITFCVVQDGDSCTQCEDGFYIRGKVCAAVLDVAGIREQLGDILRELPSDCRCGVDATDTCTALKNAAVQSLGKMHGPDAGTVKRSLALLAPFKADGLIEQVTALSPCATKFMTTAFKAATYKAESWLPSH